jgi:hypothetical protein
MRGGPIDLTPFASLLTGIGWLYWLLAALGLWWALKAKRSWKARSLRAFAVVVLFGLLPGLVAWKGLQKMLKLNSAMALFEERCKTAGEKVFRTVDNVEGVLWMKWRERTSNADNYADQWKLNDPYGTDCGAEDCIARLLRVSSGHSLNPESARRHLQGYRYVETTDPLDHIRYRYTAAMKLYWKQYDIDRHKAAGGGELPPDSYQFAIERTPINEFTVRYGLTWEDISTRQDREHWIAGGSLKVVDLRTKEVLAERVGFMIDQGQGHQEGLRSPWLEAVRSACPVFPSQRPSSPRPKRDHVDTETRRFAFRVLRPSQGEQ